MSAAAGIVLIGMMGSGKSTLAPLLAAELGVDWIDVDARIEQAAGKSVARIFAEDGEGRFRELESETLEQALAHPGAVIAVGGGAPLRQRNRELLDASGCRCIYLQVADQLLVQRVGDGQGRPLLAAGDPATQIAKLTGERARLYEDVADLAVRVDRPEPAAETCRRILDALA